MPDISMCKDDNCPARYTCYRYMAEPDTYQAYADFARPVEGITCNHYFSISPWPTSGLGSMASSKDEEKRER